jgi:hypothetical protein
MRARLLRSAPVAILVALALGPLSAARATTGATPLAHPPRFDVTKAQAAPFLGHFVLAKRPRSRLVSGAYVAGFNENGYVEGSLAIYTYNRRGTEVSWVGRTYEYHYTRGGMTIDVISAANEQIFARLRLRSGRHGRLVGALRELLPVPRKAIPIVFRPAPR